MSAEGGVHKQHAPSKKNCPTPLRSSHDLDRSTYSAFEARKTLQCLERLCCFKQRRVLEGIFDSCLEAARARSSIFGRRRWNAVETKLTRKILVGDLRRIDLGTSVLCDEFDFGATWSNAATFVEDARAKIKRRGKLAARWENPWRATGPNYRRTYRRANSNSGEIPGLSQLSVGLRLS